MNRDDFEEGLKELDQEFEVAGLPPDVDARLKARLSRSPRRPAWPWLLAAAATAGVVLAVVLPARAPQTLGGFTVLTRGADLEAQVADDGLVRVTRGVVSLRDGTSQAVMELEAGAEVARLGAGARVRSGTVRFEVVHVARPAPYSVQVSGGTIEVLGTAFTVTQGEGQGSVSLQRGSIRFRATDGREVLLAPGDSVRWPLPPPPAEPAGAPEAAPLPKKPAPRVLPARPAPQPATAEVVPEAPPPAAFSAEAVLAQVAALRSRGAFEEAVGVLTRAQREAPPGATRERLGFELGSILSHQLRDVPRACAHWAAYQQENAAGRYAREVTAVSRQLGCSGK